MIQASPERSCLNLRRQNHKARKDRNRLRIQGSTLNLKLQPHNQQIKASEDSLFKQTQTYKQGKTQQ